MKNFYIYLIVMAGVTYLIRMLPLVLVKKKIKNKYLLSFLYYIPYAVLSAMTFPGVFYATGSVISAVAGTIAALVLAYLKRSMVSVAAVSCGVVFITEFIMKMI